MKNSMMKLRTLSFLTSEYFTDALRISLSVVIPVIVAFSLDYSHEAIAIGLGSLMISLTDSAGSLEQKKTMSFIAVPLFFILSLLNASLWAHPVILGVVLTILVFSCSMLAVFGTRYYLLGTASIILSIFVLGFRPHDPLIFSVCVLIGTSWYYLISLLQSRLFPFKSARHSVAECISATGDFLKVKALFYRVDVSLDDAEKQLLSGHLRVNEKQELLRSIVLRDRRARNPESSGGKRLLRISVAVIDLYEEINEVHYDYQYLRTTLRPSGVLELVCNIIDLMSSELFRLAYGLTSGAGVPLQDHYRQELELLQERLQYIIERESHEHAGLLGRLKLNVIGLSARIEEIRAALSKTESMDAEPSEISYDHFISNPDKPLNILARHINTNSGIFRFSARLTLACLFGYLLSLFLPLGTYSYWILLTIVIIMRPSFQHTVKRNKERLAGSLMGIIFGSLLLYVTHGAALQLTLACFSLLCFFALNRVNYKLSVVFVTIMVVLCLNIYTGADTVFIIERLVDTLLGCGIAFAAAYVFPVWESSQISFFMSEVLKANIAYLEKLLLDMQGKPEPLTSYKLSRKDAYVSLANLSSAFNGMLAEPRRFSLQEKNIYRFQTLNQMLTSVLSSLFSASRLSHKLNVEIPDIATVRIAIGILRDSLLLLDGNLTFQEKNDVREEWLLKICWEIQCHSSFFRN